jgi:hypothetical protein
MPDPAWMLECAAFNTRWRLIHPQSLAMLWRAPAPRA